MLMQKDFDRWNEKKKITNADDTRKLCHDREIWWAAFGVNIGREQDGRGDNFERPIVVYSVLSSDTFLAVPLSTKKRMDKFQSLIVHEAVSGYALLDQIKVLDKKRLLRKIGMVKQEEFDILRKKLKDLL